MVRETVPDYTFRRLKQASEEGRLVFPSALDQALMARLRVMRPEEFSALPDSAEGLDRALQSAARDCVRREELTDRLSGKRYPRARIRRLCTAALLGLRKDGLPETPDCAVIIGVRPGMERLLRPVSPDFPLLTRSRDYPFSAPWFQAERRAADLWALAAGLPAGLWEKAPLIRPES